MRRSNNQTAFRFGAYIVNLERIKNTPSGGPRFKAIIINSEEAEKWRGGVGSAVYTFQGHYCSDRSEANFILKRHIEKFLTAEEVAKIIDEED